MLHDCSLCDIMLGLQTHVLLFCYLYFTSDMFYYSTLKGRMEHFIYFCQTPSVCCLAFFLEELFLSSIFYCVSYHYLHLLGGKMNRLTVYKRLTANHSMDVPSRMTVIP